MVLNGIRMLHQKKSRRPPCTHPLPFNTLRHLTSHHPSQPNYDEFLSSFIFLSLVHSDWTFYLLTSSPFILIHTSLIRHITSVSTESLTF